MGSVTIVTTSNSAAEGQAQTIGSDSELWPFLYHGSLALSLILQLEFSELLALDDFYCRPTSYHQRQYQHARKGALQLEGRGADVFNRKIITIIYPAQRNSSM